MRLPATETADWLVSIQDAEGGFFNFQKPDGSFVPLQSGNVNFYASMALWMFGEVYGGAPRLFARPRNCSSTSSPATSSAVPPTALP
jgi:hypothetical protein